jgi:selenide,water dikinase
LSELPLQTDPRLLAGFEHAEDAGVFLIAPDRALVQTVDFFTPIADDPYVFGAIAAANALSDVYAMGGKPLTALNIVCFPSGPENLGILKAILRGGADKLHEAGALLLGGHSVVDDEIKFGLSVTGEVRPEDVKTNDAAKPGDVIYLTKPLGTGLYATALKREALGEEEFAAAAESMMRLNREAAEAMVAAKADAATDVTGYGLLGHALEMAMASRVGMVFQADRIPLLPRALELAGKGMIAGGLKRNREHFQGRVEFSPAVSEAIRTVLWDPQTSGGLLIAVPAAGAALLEDELQKRGVAVIARIGDVVAEHPGRGRII